MSEEERDYRSKKATDEPDVEGHSKGKLANEESGDDVEGHMRGRKATDDPYGSDDDVEAHIKGSKK